MAVDGGGLLLQGVKDRFGGLTVKLDPKEHATLKPSEFSVLLQRMLAMWERDGVRGVWLRVPAILAHLIESVVAFGFDFHHAQPGYVMLTKWLESSPSSLPAYPHHQIGVGGLVLASDGQRVLCIQERSGVTAGMKDFWKLPGGLVDPGEDLATAVVREVREETGINAVFDCVATIRESHVAPFGCTDLYAICVLRLDEGSYGPSTPAPVPQEREIAATEWRDLRSFLESPYYAKGIYGSMLKTAADIALRRRRGEVSVGVQRTKMKGLARREESMYYSGGEALTQSRL
eukprot:TRINITY_DN71846_c0_g1_i1.p1 TRINITY_DN71846_c0_g1~~TRINITY_DN71846_c0_g1_i1.p1  ORF type:complete len:309 (-),score=42.90 TRINITY_DN71846_c0_g1_i1:48-914(-)